MKTYQFTAFRNERYAAYGEVQAESQDEAKAKIMELFYEGGPELEFDDYVHGEAPDHIILTDAASTAKKAMQAAGGAA